MTTLGIEWTDALQTGVTPALNSLVSAQFASDATEPAQLLEFLLMLLSQNLSLTDLASQMKDVVSTEMSDTQMQEFVKKVWNCIRAFSKKGKSVASVIVVASPPAPAATTTAVTSSTSTAASAPALSSPSMTNVKAAAKEASATASTTTTTATTAAPTRKRLDRSSNVNPALDTSATPSKMIKLSHTSAAPANTSETETSGQPSAASASTAASGQPSIPSRVVKLGSSAKPSTGPVEARKARFGVISTTAANHDSSDSAMVDTLQPTAPPPRAATATSSDTAAVPAVVSSVNTIRRLRNPNEVKYTYEDEAKDRAAAEEKKRVEQEELQRQLRAASEEAAAKRMIRCIHWPQCNLNNECPYHHPSAICAAFPNCKFGDSCLNIHPSLPCKYGILCTNATCGFTHPPGRRLRTASSGGAAMMGGSGGAASKSEIPCRFGVNCARPDCFFSHPPTRATPLGGKTAPRANPSSIPCKFIPCLNPVCPFLHAPKDTATTVPSATATAAAMSESKQESKQE